MIVMESSKFSLRVNRLFAMTALATMACLPNWALAQIYMCKDAAGRTITSDRPIPECANRAMKELNKSGSVKREIPAPPTPEEIEQKKQADAKRKVEEAEATEIRRRDVGLLATYQNEQQIETERKRTITQIRNNITIAVTEQNAALQRRKVAQTEADSLTRQSKPVPFALKARLTEADKSILYETKTKEALEAELVKVSLKYDEILARYRLISVNGPGAAGTAASIAPKP